MTRENCFLVVRIITVAYYSLKFSSLVSFCRSDLKIRRTARIKDTVLDTIVRRSGIFISILEYTKTSMMNRHRSASLSRTNAPFNPGNRSSSLNRSNAPFSLVRHRSSSVGNRSSQGSRATGSFMAEGCIGMKDTRPLADKHFHAGLVRKLIDFLTKNTYPNVITPKMLTSPLMRDVNRIFEFIYSFLHPNFKLSKTPVEDIIRITKCLQYPFTLRKSSLQNFGGARHAWGEVLSMLVWLTEFVELFRHTPPCQDVSDERMKIIGETYQFSMENENDGDELEKMFEQLGGVNETRDKLLILQEEIEKVELERKEIEAQEENMQVVVKQREQCEDEIQNLRMYIKDMTEHMQSRHSEYEQLVTKCNQQELSCKALQEERNQLKQVIRQQEGKGLSNELLRKQKQDKVERVGQEEDVLQELKNQWLELKRKLSQLECQIRAKFCELNKSLSIACRGEEFATPKEFKADFPSLSLEQQNECYEQLLAYKKHIREKDMALETKHLQIEDYVIELEEQMRKLQTEEEEIEKQIEKNLTQHEEFKLKIGSECDKLHAELEALSVVRSTKTGFALDDQHRIASDLERQLQDMECQVREERKKLENELKNQMTRDKVERKWEVMSRPMMERFERAMSELMK